MLTVELTEKELRVLQLMIGEEIRESRKNIIKIREDGGAGCYCLIDDLEERNNMLAKIKNKLHNTKKYIEEE